MITCSRRIQFCAGHRVFGHENKCSHMHGHNYVVEIEAAAIDGLDTIGRIVDFGVIKDYVGRWIETFWDHGFILQESDSAAINAIQNLAARSVSNVDVVMQKIFCLPMNPTAENIADYLLRVVCPNELIRFSVVVISVVVHETENCKAISFLTPGEFQGAVDAKRKAKQNGEIAFGTPNPADPKPGAADASANQFFKEPEPPAASSPSGAGDNDSNHFIQTDVTLPDTKWKK